MSEAGDGMGSAATGALWARTIEQKTHGAGAGHEDRGPCANCGTAPVGPFCHACGQSGHVHRNASALAHDIAHGVFHFEGKLWNTLPLLIWHPGRLTRRYVDGERVKFVSPMAMFLFSVFLMFAVLSNISAHHGPGEHAQDEVASTAQKKLDKARRELAVLQTAKAVVPDAEANQDFDKEIRAKTEEIKALSVAARGSSLIQTGEDVDPKAVHLNTGWRWFDSAVQHMSGNPELTIYKMKTYGYKYSWALIPISLPFIWLLFAFRRDVGLYDHAIFSIYSLSFMSLGVIALGLFGWAGLPSAIIALLAMLVPPVHMYRQLKGTYALGRFGAGWRTLALLIVISITASLFISFLFYMGTG